MVFCWLLDCKRVDLILEFKTSDVTDWKVLSSGHKSMLRYLQVFFLCPDVLCPS